MSNFLPFGAATYNLGSSIGSTDSTILLSSFLEPVTGTPYTMALINSDIAYGTISPKTTSSEFISFTGIIQNSNGTATLTGVTRGLAKKYPFTSDATYQLPHSGQSTFIISDAPQVFNKYVTLEDTETISGTKTFSASPIVPTPTTPTQAANKAYADALAIAGAPNASTSVQGLVQEATQAQVDAKTVIGSTGAKLFQNLSTVRSTLTSDYIADTGSANTYAITPSPAITAYTTGQIFSFKATNANTTASTLNVSSLGVKNIFKRGSLALDADDIIVGQIVQVEYDGTQFQMLSQLGKAKISQIGTEIYAADSVGTDAYAITLVPAITAYTTGLVVNFKAGTANTGNATLNVNAVGAKNILKGFNQTLATGDIALGQIVTVVYDATADNFQMQSQTAQIVTVFQGALTDTGSVSSTQNIDTVFTPGFQASVIEIHYWLQGNDGAAKYSLGIARFSATTLISNLIFYNNVASAATPAAVTVMTLDSAAVSQPGSNSSVVLTVNAITATTFTIRAAVTRSSGAAEAIFSVTAWR